MKYYMLAITDDGEFSDIRKMKNDECIMPTYRVRELRDIERRYKEHINSLKDHTMIDDERYLELLKTEHEFKDIKRSIGIDEFKGHYSADPIKYAVHILKAYLNAYLTKNNAKLMGLTEKKMLTVAFCHRIEEGLIDYLEELEEFNS